MAIERSSAQAKRILVVEDEVMIRMLLEDMLGELGYTIAAEAARIEEALEATKNADFDLAILDANLNGQPASPVADALVALGTPFVFATGYGEVPEPYCDRPTLKKPFQIDKLKQMLQGALDSLWSLLRLLLSKGHTIRVPYVCRVRPDRYHATSGCAFRATGR